MPMKKDEDNSLYLISEKSKKFQRLLTRDEEHELIGAYQKPIKELLELLVLKFPRVPPETPKQHQTRMLGLSMNLTLHKGTKYYNTTADRALTKLVNHNLRLIIKPAKAFYRKLKAKMDHTVHLDEWDLFVEGYLGFIHGLNKFDLSRVNKEGLPLKLSTYIVFWINQAIKRGIQDKERTIRIPIHIHDQIDRLKRIYGRACSASYDMTSPTPKELAALAGIEIEAAMRLGRHIHPIESLNVTVNEEENMTAEEFLSADEEKYSPDGEKVLERRFNREKLLQYIDKYFAQDDIKFFILRYGLGPDEVDRTDKEMANIFECKVKDILIREKRLIQQLREVVDARDFCY